MTDNRKTSNVTITLIICVLAIAVFMGGCNKNSEATGQVSAAVVEDVSDSAAVDDVPASAAVDETDLNLDIKENPKKENQEETAVSENVTQDGINIETTAPTNDVYKIFDNTLFIGDSRTEGFMLYSGVNNANYFCGKGLTVDKMVEGKELKIKGENVSVHEVLDKKQYDRVYISAGLNELGWYSIDTFRDNYGKLIQLVKEKQPDAQILLQAVLPVTVQVSDNSSKNNNAQIYWYNVNIKELSEIYEVGYVNAASAVVDSSGYLNPEGTWDGIHMKKELCEKWAVYLANKPRGEE